MISSFCKTAENHSCKTERGKIKCNLLELTFAINAGMFLLEAINI